MAVIAPLKAHLVKTTTTSGLNPQRRARGMVADISPEVLFRVHAGDSAVSTVPIESYTLFLPLFYYYALLLQYYWCIVILHVLLPSGKRGE